MQGGRDGGGPAAVVGTALRVLPRSPGRRRHPRQRRRRRPGRRQRGRRDAAGGGGACRQAGRRADVAQTRSERQLRHSHRYGRNDSGQVVHTAQLQVRDAASAVFILLTLTLGGHSLPDMELGQWVTGSMGHLGHLSRPRHRVIILTRCETRVFPVFEKMPKMQNVQLKC